MACKIIAFLHGIPQVYQVVIHLPEKPLFIFIEVDFLETNCSAFLTIGCGCTMFYLELYLHVPLGSLGSMVRINGL